MKKKIKPTAKTDKIPYKSPIKDNNPFFVCRDIHSCDITLVTSGLPIPACSADPALWPPWSQSFFLVQDRSDGVRKIEERQGYDYVPVRLDEYPMDNKLQ